MRLFRISLESDHGSRICATYMVAKATMREALDRAVEHYKMINNGVDVRVESIKDAGNVLL